MRQAETTIPSSLPVFVYGTMRRGQRLHQVLARATPLGLARTAAAYNLFDLEAFPAMTEGGSTTVTGELWQADKGTMMVIDAIEGHPEFFVRQEIELADGRSAFAWLLHPGRRDWAIRRIESGDWCRHRSGELKATLPDPPRPSSGTCSIASRNP